jgi:hypothetical protein
VACRPFAPPPESAWVEIREKCATHLGAGRSLATLPYATRRFGCCSVSSFAELRSDLTAEIIEVYPFAIVRALFSKCEHKSTANGYQSQLAELAVRTGWEPPELEANLKASVSGSRHDRLDAFIAEWVASLPSAKRRAFGHARRP